MSRLIQLNLLYKKYLTNLEEDELEKKRLEFNISDLHKQMYNKNRFNTITTVVVDYDMPEMDGITFCKKINNPNIFKIMLTGAADKDLAVDAFNQNIIQAFVPKHDENIYETLEKYIKKGSDSYFDKISEVIFMALEKEKHNAFIRDQNFISFFEKVLRDNNISEFYLVEGNGSYVLVNKEGKVDVFYLVPGEDAKQLYEDVQENNLDAKDLEALKANEKIICTIDLANTTKNIEYSLTSCLESARPITIGKVNYHYAYKRNIPISSSILTFKEFLKQYQYC